MSLLVNPFPAGYLVSIDGTSDYPTQPSPTIITQFDNHYRQFVKPLGGVGNVIDFPGPANLLEQAFALQATSVLDNAYAAVVNAHQSAQMRKTTPIDIIGYSRGAFIATALAKLILDDGIINLASVHKVKFPYGKNIYYWTWSSFSDTPKVRFLGLVSPVGQMGANPLVSVLTLGNVQLNFGWPTSAPAGVEDVAQVLDGDPGNVILPQTTIGTSPGQSSGPTVFPGDSHQQIGYDQAALRTLLDDAANADVPVTDYVP